MIKFISLAASILLLSGVSLADVEPVHLEPPSAGCSKLRMCNAQTLVGPCTASPASGETIVVQSANRSQLTWYSLQSVGAHICNLETSDQSFDDSSGVGFKFNQNSLTEVAPVLTLSGLFDFIWVDCPTIDTSVTITLLICTSNR